MTYTIENHLLQGDNVEHRQSPNHSGHIDPDIIVAHHTGGWPDGEGSISWLCNPESQASAHLVIAHDGKTTQLVKFDLKAWHAGSSSSSYHGQSPNSISVGVELANPGRLVDVGGGKYAQDGNPSMVYDGAEWGIRWIEGSFDKGFYIPFSDAQQLAHVEIGRLLVREYEMSDTTTHQLVDPTRKVDPHPGYSLAAYNDAVLGAGEAPPHPPAQGHEDVTTARVTVGYRWPSFKSPHIHWRSDRRLPVDRFGTYTNEVDGSEDTSVWYCISGDEEVWVREQDLEA